MKIRVSINIDVSKIDKSRLVKGKKGTYLDLTTMIDTDQQDQYGNNGFIAQAVSKEERQGGTKGNILGNSKVVWVEPTVAQAAPAEQETAPDFDDFQDSEVPF